MNSWVLTQLPAWSRDITVPASGVSSQLKVEKFDCRAFRLLALPDQPPVSTGGRRGVPVIREDSSAIAVRILGDNAAPLVIVSNGIRSNGCSFLPHLARTSEVLLAC